MRNFFAALALIAGTALVPALALAQAITGDVNPNASATVCVNLQNDLSRGQSDSQTGGEVSILQTFLQSTSTAGSNTPYLAGDPTGFFGIQTETAVKQFQADRQLLASGFVGPLTRAKIKGLTCPTAAPASPMLSASPSSGTAPLSVNFSFQANQPQTSYRVDFGDGQTSSSITPCPQAGTCVGGLGNVSHSYISMGPYTARLLDANNQVLGTATITVAQATATTPTAALTYNGATSLQNVDPLASGTWAWVSTNADVITGIAVISGCSDPAQNTIISPWSPWASANTARESGSATVLPGAGLSGCTMSATYSASAANSTTGTRADATVTLRFKVIPDTAPGECVALTKDLSLGSRDSGTNGEVSILQKYLRSANSPATGFPYLSTAPTGYFGILTQTAVRQFQTDRGILSSGFVGPTTRAKIKDLTCGGGETAPVSFSATPASGSAPLAVMFRVDGIWDESAYFVSFGDGTSAKISVIGGRECLPSSTNCNPNIFGADHTYTSAGTYTAKLQQQIVCITTPCIPPTLGTVTITVTGTVPPPPPSAAACTDLQNDMSYRFADWQTNGEVSLLQDFFQSAISPATGAPYLTGEPTGFFGQLTQTAVRRFQEDNGLPASSMVDFLTRAKIQEVSCGSTPPPPPPPPIAECTDLRNDLAHRSTDSQTNGEVSLLQAFFQSVTSPATGVQYLTGEPTGFFGQLTKAAVIQFQTDNGLTATGVAGPATRAKISALTCGDTPPPPPPPPPPEVCNVDAEMQSCINGAYAARIGPDCSWLACPYKPVVPTAPTINSFTAAATSLAYEGSTNLSWNITSSPGATCSLSINGGTTTSVPTNNSAYNTGALTGTTKYTLSCSTDSGPVATKDVTVKVASRELSCASQQQPQYVYGYGKLDADGKPFIRLQGNCSYFTGYSVFDTGWVQGAQLSKSGNCPVGLGLAVSGTASLDKSGLNVMSSYGGGYEGSCTAPWPASFKWPASSSTDTRPGPTVNLAQSSVSSYGQNSISWNSANADSCTIAYSTDGLNFTSWKFGTSGSNVDTSQISGFNSPGTWVFRATCIGNGNPAVDKVTHTIISAPSSAD